MNELDFNKKLLNLMESFPMMGVVPTEQEQDKESASYTKTKKTDKGSVTVSANAESMADLHDVLKLAGITLPNSEKDPEDQPTEPDHVEDPYDKDGDKICDCCGKEIVDGDCGCDDHDHPDVSYSTDKQAIVDMLRHKLQQQVS